MIISLNTVPNSIRAVAESQLISNGTLCVKNKNGHFIESVLIRVARLIYQTRKRRNRRLISVSAWLTEISRR